MKGNPNGIKCSYLLFGLSGKIEISLSSNGRSQCPNVAKEIRARALEYTHCACSFTATKKWILRSVRWEKPNTRWMKLNTDRASSGNLRLARGGGAIRDEKGNWVIGYARKIGITTSFLAELWALQDGIFLCSQVHV